MLSKIIKNKTRSKKGFTLVEAMCSVVILAIVTVGVLNAVAFSREMIYSNNNRDKASDKAQLVADEIVSAVTGVDPTLGEEAFVTIDNKVYAIANDSAGGDIQSRVIGNVIRVGEFEAPDPDDSDPTLIQYILIPRETDEDNEVTEVVRVDGADAEINVVESMQSGWDIQVRVYYKQIGGSGNYKAVDVSAFAPVSVSAVDMS